MSLIKKLIQKKKNPPTKKQKSQQINDAIHKLRAQIVVLEKRKTHSEKQVLQYTKAAQQCLKNKNRNGALAKLKLKKQVEKRIETLDNQMFNLEVQCMALEEAIMNAKQIEAMKTAAEAMKGAINEKDLDDAEEIQETLQEGMDLGQELNDILNQPLVDCGEDEDLLAELDDIMDDGLLYNNNNMKKVQPKIEMKEDPIQDEEEEEEEEEESEEDKEIRKLEMEMNMNSRPIIDVQIVERSSPRMMIATC